MEYEYEYEYAYDYEYEYEYECECECEYECEYEYELEQDLASFQKEGYMELPQCSLNMYTINILFLISCSCTLSFVAEFKKVKTATSDKIYNSCYPLFFFFSM